jgi:hypothetical protein
MAKAKKTESAETPETKKTPAAKAAPKAAKPAAKASPAAKAPPAAAAAAKQPAAAAGKKAPAKVAKKSAPASGTPGTPLIDTDLAAQNAASMLLNRPTAPTGGTPQSGKESSAFKNLKDQLAKPKPSGLSNLFGPTGGGPKSVGHFNAHQQKGHNQTFGGMNKTGVPRRTNG